MTNFGSKWIRTRAFYSDSDSFFSQDCPWNSLPGDVGGVKRLVIFNFSRRLRSPVQSACRPGLAIPFPADDSSIDVAFIRLTLTYLWRCITDIINENIIFKLAGCHAVDRGEITCRLGWLSQIGIIEENQIHSIEIIINKKLTKKSGLFYSEREEISTWRLKGTCASCGWNSWFITAPARSRSAALKKW